MSENRHSFFGPWI